MPNRNRPLWIVLLVTCCLVLRGLMPAQAHVAIHDACASNTAQPMMESGCKMDHDMVPDLAPMSHHTAVPQSALAPHDDKCNACPPAMSCLAGFVALLPDIATTPRAVNLARYAPLPDFTLTGLRQMPDQRPPRTS